MDEVEASSILFSSIAASLLIVFQRCLQAGKHLFLAQQLHNCMKIGRVAPRVTAMRITEDTSPTWPLKACGVFFIFLYVRCIAERSAELFDLGKPCVFIICVAVNGQISAQDFRSGRSRQFSGNA